MTEGAGGQPNDIARLLYKAVRTLPDDEQQAIFAHFFERGIAVAQLPVIERIVVTDDQEHPELEGTPGTAAAKRASVVNMLTAMKSPGPAQQVVPVRLSEESHRRLKEWCAEHNFPMAVVVRGLIDRFLDSWQERAA